MKLFDLEIRFLTGKSRDRGPANFCSWTTYSGISATYNHRKPTILLYNKDSIDKTLKDKHANINEIEKLYFDSESSYPRFKIKDTKFSRVIKVDNSDAAVIPNDILISETKVAYNVYKGSNNIYIISEDSFKSNNQAIYNKIMEYGDNFEDALRTINILPKDTTLIYSGKLCFCEERFQQTIHNIMDIYTKYVTEDDIDTIVNKSLEKLTEETAMSLNGMLSSTDPAIVELGLKILQGVDVLNTPLTVKLLLVGNYENISKNKAINTTGVSQIFKTLKLTLWSVPPYPGSLNLIFKSEFWDKASTEDKQLSLTVGREIISNFFSNGWTNLRKIVPNLPYNVKTYVE